MIALPASLPTSIPCEHWDTHGAHPRINSMILMDCIFGTHVYVVVSEDVSGSGAAGGPQAEVAGISLGWL